MARHAIFFEGGTTFRDPEAAAATLDALAAMLGEAPPAVRLRIAGYADELGGPSGTGPVSLERARAVADALVARGIPSGRIVVVGRSAQRPLSDETGAAVPTAESSSSWPMGASEVPAATLSKKICMLGDFAVGKTSLVRRYVLGEFSPEYQATIGVNVYKYTDRIEGGAAGSVQLQQIIWDIEGSEDRSSLLKTYVHGASGALVVGDLTRPDTLESMARHARTFLGVQPGRPVVFALNKTDLLEPGAAAAAAGNLTGEFGAPACETSALSGAGVPEAFASLERSIVQRGT